MKKAVSIILLFVFLVPFVYKCGVISYFELNQNYIASNFCVNRDKPITMCYGRCFLDKALNAVDQKADSSKLVQAKFQFLDYSLTHFVISFAYKEIPTDFPFANFKILHDGIAYSVFRPPLS